jgi:hypothetical protein
MADDVKALPAKVVGKRQHIGGSLGRREFATKISRFSVTTNFGKSKRKVLRVEKISRKCPRITASVKVMQDDNAFVATPIKLMS